MDNRKGPRDNHRDRDDRHSRQQGGDYGSARQQGQYSQDYRQQGEGPRRERDEWSAGDEFGYSDDQRRGMSENDRMPGRGEGGRYEWSIRPADDDRQRDDVFGAHRGYGGRSIAGGQPGNRSYERGHSEGGRDFWDRASDEVSSWFGDSDAERRREMDKHRGRGPKNYTRSDERIREDINDRLTDDGWLDATNIDVEVANREVTLTGHVYNRSAKRRSEDLAEGVSGVVHVQNNLRVSDTYAEPGTAQQGGTSDSSSTFTSVRKNVDD